MLSLIPRIRALYSVPGEGGQGGGWEAGDGGWRCRIKVKEVRREKQCLEGLSIQQKEEQQKDELNTKEEKIITEMNLWR